MPVTKEWTCLAHGAFDGPSLDDGGTPPCPKGCGASMVQRAFRTAPSFQTAGYRRMNSTFDSLAREHGLSDIRNRNAVQDQTGMKRATLDTYKRLNEATAAVIGPSKAGMQGVDANSFFKPLNEFQPGSTGEGGVLRRTESGGVMSGAIPLAKPTPRIEGVFDGRQAGLPQGDA